MEIKRKNNRQANQLREMKIHLDYVKYAEGSCLIEAGETRLICAVTVEEKVPLFLKETGSGWVTAEYNLLPYSTPLRVQRLSNQSGRSQEIQRMIGRSLRGITVLKNLGERTFWVDCDVIQADGGTRMAAVTGAFVALTLALNKLRQKNIIRLPVLRDYLAGVSVGIVDGCLLLDLDYDEDSRATVDFNVVMTGRGELVELQGTGEARPFSRSELESLLELAASGVRAVISLIRGILDEDTALLFGK